MSHLLCPISRQPVQFCESAACFGFAGVNVLKKKDMCVGVCVCVHSCIYYFLEYVCVKCERVTNALRKAI